MVVKGSITKSELARLYNVTTKTLSRWIHQHRALYAELTFTGYKKRQKTLNTKQVEIIIKYFGNP